MKTKSLTIIIALLVVNSLSYSQSKPLTKQQLSKLSEFVSAEHIMLVFNGHEINMLSIKQSNITDLLGKPKQIKKEKSEIDEQIHTMYIYESGEIDFDAQKKLYGLEIKKQGWAFVLKVDDKITKPFTIGENLEALKKTFPRSFANMKTIKREDMLGIGLITKNKIPIESDILFGVKDGHIVYMSFAENDS